MHALVTGGAGFVGSVLVDRLLAEGHRVDVVDNLTTGSLANLADARRIGGRDLSFHQLDVRSADVTDLIGRRQPEVIWHLAAATSVPASLDQAALDADVNIVGTLNVLEAARAGSCRKVIVTSCAAAVYGEPGPGALPITERHPRQPRSPHGIAKHAVDAYLVAFRDLHGLEFTSMVLGTVYGPRDVHGVVGVWAAELLAGSPGTVFGDGEQTRDFVFVDDVVDALSRAAERGDGLMLNIGTGVETSLNTLYARLAERVRSARAAGAGAVAGPEVGPEAGPGRSAPGELPAPRYAPARKADIGRNRLDTTRARLHLDWQPWTTLEQGLTAVVEHLMAGQASYQPHEQDEPLGG